MPIQTVTLSHYWQSLHTKTSWMSLGFPAIPAHDTSCHVLHIQQPIQGSVDSFSGSPHPAQQTTFVGVTTAFFFWFVFPVVFLISSLQRRTFVIISICMYIVLYCVTGSCRPFRRSAEMHCLYELWGKGELFVSTTLTILVCIMCVWCLHIFTSLKSMQSASPHQNLLVMF